MNAKPLMKKVAVGHKIKEQNSFVISKPSTGKGSPRMRQLLYRIPCLIYTRLHFEYCMFSVDLQGKYFKKGDLGPKNVHSLAMVTQSRFFLLTPTRQSWV